MKLFSTRPIVVAGLAGVLALGALGCSTSTTTTTSVSDGETTTETTTTTTDGQSTTAKSSEKDLSQAKNFTLDAIGLVYTLPEGYQFVDGNTEADYAQLDSEVLAFKAANDANDYFMLTVTPDAKDTDVTTDQYAQQKIEQVKKGVAKDGAEVTDAKAFLAAFGDKRLPAIDVIINKDGKTIMMREIFASSDTLKAVLTFEAQATDVNTLDAMCEGLRV